MQDGLLDFGEFCDFIRAREQGERSEGRSEGDSEGRGEGLSDEALRRRFDELDTTGDGSVDIREVINHELRAAISRSSARVIDLLTLWDEDCNGKIDQHEFFRSLRALGFSVTQAESDECFASLDKDEGGRIEYKELNTLLQTAVSLTDQRKKGLAAGRRSQAVDKGALTGAVVPPAGPSFREQVQSTMSSVDETLATALAEGVIKLVRCSWLLGLQGLPLASNGSGGGGGGGGHGGGHGGSGGGGMARAPSEEGPFEKYNDLSADVPFRDMISPLIGTVYSPCEGVCACDCMQVRAGALQPQRGVCRAPWRAVTFPRLRAARAAALPRFRAARQAAALPRSHAAPRLTRSRRPRRPRRPRASSACKSYLPTPSRHPRRR